MPYKVVKAGRRWRVVSEGSGRTLGTHATKAQARAQQRAVYANASPEKRAAMRAGA